jgi:hypothetical protein
VNEFFEEEHILVDVDKSAIEHHVLEQTSNWIKFHKY